MFTSRAPTTAPAGSADVPYCYRLAHDLEAGWPRMYLSGPLTPHTFENVLWRDIVALFVVSGPKGRCGIAGLYDVDYRHRTGWVEFASITEPGEAEAVRYRALTTVTHLAFHRLGLRKLFCLHLGCHEPPLGGTGREEARLRDTVLHSNWYWDQIITGLDLSTWESYTQANGQ